MAGVAAKGPRSGGARGGSTDESGEVAPARRDARGSAALDIPGARTLRSPMITSTILIRNGTALPESLGLKSEPYSGNWRSVTNLDRQGLDNQLGKAGWTFF